MGKLSGVGAAVVGLLRSAGRIRPRKTGPEYAHTPTDSATAHVAFEVAHPLLDHGPSGDYGATAILYSAYGIGRIDMRDFARGRGLYYDKSGVRIPLKVEGNLLPLLNRGILKRYDITHWGGYEGEDMTAIATGVVSRRVMVDKTETLLPAEEHSSNIRTVDAAILRDFKDLIRFSRPGKEPISPRRVLLDVTFERGTWKL